MNCPYYDSPVDCSNAHGVKEAKLAAAESREKALREALGGLFGLLDVELPFDHLSYEGHECESFAGGECNCGAQDRNLEAGALMAKARAALAAGKEDA